MEPAVWKTDAEGNPDGDGITDELDENTFYLFHPEGLQAVTHAIEDIALEEGRGKLMAAVQDYKQFEPQRERYWQLAATLDDVQIIATGKSPRKNGRLKYCNDSKSLFKKFWIVIYEGLHCRTMFLAEQSNKATHFEEKKFIGFYTFNSKLIDQAAEEIANVLGGHCPHLKQFHQLHTVDRAAKQIAIEFAREKKAMEIAISKLQDHGCGYHPENFIKDLDKTLERLKEWKTRLPESSCRK